MFKDPIAIKDQKPKNEPKGWSSKKSPWDFRCPSYDERTSNFISAGTHYGVGYNQPVGHEGNPKPAAAVLPFGRGPVIKTDERG